MEKMDKPVGDMKALNPKANSFDKQWFFKKKKT